ncbi:MAG: STAS domain-containing protein [Bryobacteraceae bacterium]|nr:STAS domain-containing protein [Bryobacteraceae bacterium]
MTVTDASIDSVAVLSLDGRLDSRTAPALKSALEEHWRRQRYRAVLDCSRLEYVSSAGLQVLLIAGKIAASHGGQLAFSGLGAFLGDVFAMTQFHQIFPVYATAEEAAAALKGE